MSDNASGGNGNSANGAAGGANNTGNGVNETALNDLVFKAVRKQFKKLDLGEAVKSAVSELLPTLVGNKDAGKTAGDQQVAKAANEAQGNSATEQERLTLKSLQERLAASDQRIERETKARQEMENRLREADARARNERMRAEAERRIAAKLGADNPLMPMFMDSFYDGKKRIVEQDGNYYVKFKDAIGDDELRPLDDGINALFDKGGEYAHLVVPPSKVNGLPPRNVNARGTAAQQQTQNGQQPPMINHPIYGTVIQALKSQGDMDKAAGLEHVVSLPAPGSDK